MRWSGLQGQLRQYGRTTFKELDHEAANHAAPPGGPPSTSPAARCSRSRPGANGLWRISLGDAGLRRRRQDAARQPVPDRVVGAVRRPCACRHRAGHRCVDLRHDGVARPPSRPAAAAIPPCRRGSASRCASSTSTTGTVRWPTSPRWTSTTPTCPSRPPSEPIRHRTSGKPLAGARVSASPRAHQAPISRLRSSDPAGMKARRCCATSATRSPWPSPTELRWIAPTCHAALPAQAWTILLSASTEPGGSQSLQPRRTGAREPSLSRRELSMVCSDGTGPGCRAGRCICPTPPAYRHQGFTRLRCG